MRALARYLEKIERILIVASGAIVFAAMVMVVFDAVVRKLAFSVPGLYETTELFVVAMVFLGMSYVMFRGRHVRVNLLVDRFGWPWANVVHLLVLALSIFVFTLILWQSLKAAYTAWAIEEVRSGLIKYPVWPAKIFVCIGVAVLWARLIVEFAGSRSDFADRRPPQSRQEAGYATRSPSAPPP